MIKKNQINKTDEKAAKKFAFTLIELSLVILIASIFIAGTMIISKTTISNAKSKVTRDKMDTVYKAFSAFLAANKRLPCPGLLNQAKPPVSSGSSYGAELGSGSNCAGNLIATSSGGNNLAYGMVPVQALNLDQDMAEDGWGTKFDYVVDTRFTIASLPLQVPFNSQYSPTGGFGNSPGPAAISSNLLDPNISSLVGFEFAKGTPNPNDLASGAPPNLGSMNIQNPSGTTLLPYYNGIFLLISHGANQYNGWNATGTQQNGNNGASADENTNSCNACNYSARTSGSSGSFVSGSTNINFDDIVLFKTKSQLVIDAGLEFIVCSGAESANTLGGNSYSWYNVNYGYSTCSISGGSTALITCNRYGQWSVPVLTACTAGTTF